MAAAEKGGALTQYFGNIYHLIGLVERKYLNRKVFKQ